jgi:hypothetical protein
MAILSKTGITTGNTVESGHVTQSIDAFSGLAEYDIFLSGSFNMTGSINGEPGVVNNLTSSFSVTASQAISSSFATTASFALNGGGGAAFPFTGSAVITGSLVVTGSTIVTGLTTLDSTLRVNGRASTQAFRVDSNTIGSNETVDVGSGDCLVGGIHTLKLNDSGSIILNLLEPSLYEPGSAWSFTFNLESPDPDSKIIIQSTPTPPNVTPSPNIWGSIVGFENGTGIRLSGETLISSSLGGPFPYCRIDLIVNDVIWYVSVVDRYETDWYIA